MKQGKEMASNDPAAQGARHKAQEPADLSTPDFQQMIAEAAYYRAQARGFAPGRELDDWLEAEAEVDTVRDQDDSA